MKRFSMAVAAMTCLGVTYQVYARWFDSLTAIDEQVQVQVPAEPPERPLQSKGLRDIARRWLPDQHWAQQANYAFERSDHVYVYAGSANLIDDPGERRGNRVRFAPFAMVIMNAEDPAAPPYVIRCDSARIRFEHPFRLELGARRPGRLVEAALDGAVNITGPDGLQIIGQNFAFSEGGSNASGPGDSPAAPALLYSDYPVEFAYGPGPGQTGRQSGSASGLQIDLIPSRDSILGRDGPRVGGIATIRLRRDVRLNLQYEQHGDDERDGELMLATVSSRGSFVFDVATHIATFEDNVVVEHPTGDAGEPQQVDTLHCDWLALQFEETPAESMHDVADSTSGDASSVLTVSAVSPEEARPRHPFANLRFRQLRAHGEPAVLRSDENKLIANMQELRYDSLTRQVVLLDDDSVQVQFDTTILNAPQVQVMHGTGGEVLSLKCLGAGRLEHYGDADDPPLFRAEWSDRLWYGPHPKSELWMIQLDGDARVIQTGHSGIQADHLALWIDQDSVSTLTEADPADAGAEVETADAAVQAARHRRLPLHYARAEGHVLMAAPEFRVQTEVLRASFTKADVTSREKVAGNVGRAPAGRNAAEAQQDSDGSWSLRADEVQVQMLHDPETDKSDVAEATARGRIEISRDPGDGDADTQPLSISGEQLHLENGGGTRQLLTMTGEPVHIRQGDLHLEGRDVVFDRGRNTAHVQGRGMLRFPVESDLSGQQLEHPVPLDVQWQEQMTFNGLEARFFGNVVLKLNDGHVNESRLYCEDLNVMLNETLSFTGDRPASREPQFKRVTCRDGVRTELYEWDGTRLNGIRVAELAEFTLEHETGLLEGLGPGVISSWSRGNGRRISIAPDATAEANQPAESNEPEWEYTQVHFSENMTGNARQRTVQLHGRVRAIYAPVQHPREVFRRDELSGDSPNAGQAVWLGCDELAVALYPWQDRQNEDYAVFGATGHCELEGKLFRAVADLISFDQSKELFTLKGLGDRKASIYYQRNPGDQPTRLPGQLIQFIPSRQRVSVQGATGFQASP